MLKTRLYAFLNQGVFERAIFRGASYRVFCEPEEIHRFQVERFNCVWKDAYTDVPFYAALKEQHQLPGRISSLGELVQWPIVSKKMLQEDPAALVRRSGPPAQFLMTGGSTGEPLRLGSWGDRQTSPSQWLGRAAYGVLPGDSTFLLWGHGHLYGKGFKRRINVVKRKVKDFLSNMHRVSAYDLSMDAMTRAYRRYLAVNPRMVIGFSASVLAFCRINRERVGENRYRPKMVLCTAGPLSPDEKNEISTFFSAPVCMEYGSVECGVMAYTEPVLNQYRVFWDTHLLQGLEDELGQTRNIVTRLEPCYVPLIRYDIGDCLDVESSEEPALSILHIDEVKGRPTDIVSLKNGVSFFSAVIGDCVKQVKSIMSSQLFVLSNEALRIDVVTAKPLTDDEKALILSRLRGVVKGMEETRIDVSQVEQLKMTVGGKIPLVVREK